MTTYRDAGFLAAAFRNFLALLGWSAGEEQEIYTLTELIEKFSLDGIHRSNAVFNFHENDARHWTDDKAIWMNAEYIRTMPLADLLPFVKAFAEEKGTKLGVIMNGARTLLTGVAVGPSMLAVFETLGRERSILRLRSQIAWNN